MALISKARAGSLAGRVSTALAGNAVLALAGQFFSSLTTFGTSMMVGRACGPDEYGLYYLGFTIVVFCLEMQNALISTPYSVYAPRQAEGALPLFRGSALLHQAGVSTAVLVGFIIAAAVAAMGFGPAGMSAVFLALSVTAASVLLRDQTRRFCFTHLQMRTALAGDILVCLLQLGLVGALFAADALTPARALLASGFACALVAAIYLTRQAGPMQFSLAHSRGQFLRHWTFAQWVVASALVWGISMNFYPWVINYFRSTYEAGLWGASFTLVALGNVFVLGLHNLLGPRMAAVFAADGAEALRGFVLMSTLAFAVPLGMLSVFLYFASAPLLSIIYGDSYTPGAPVMFILSINLLMLGVASVFSRGLFALERADLDFQVNFLPLVLLFAAGIPLVRSHGIKGAAWALCLANGVALASRAAAFMLAQPRQEHAAG